MADTPVTSINERSETIARDEPRVTDTVELAELKMLAAKLSEAIARYEPRVADTSVTSSNARSEIIARDKPRVLLGIWSYMSPGQLKVR
eukprot:CAMPEP_0194360768 /NCGR_PEP_ID=MMETSP0174-20130528/8185_1 /TAXON_ID=216777 /ORGANISM="Proboscia alata, Strain PI-D3" /LENGTH=88 /DNA_ID=CAMNT_0039132487 /DNA_START=21 /DNA_END=284 /DNA_ORIENTATION=+